MLLSINLFPALARQSEILSQFSTVKTLLALKRIKSFRRSEHLLHKDMYWQDDDFKPIYNEFLKIFREKGWLK